MKALPEIRNRRNCGIDSPPKLYKYAFWNDYKEYCKKLSLDLNLDMRTIDKGLWQYSKEKQKKYEESKLGAKYSGFETIFITHHEEISWLNETPPKQANIPLVGSNASAQNIPFISVTLLTSQLPIFWLKQFLIMT